MIRAQYGIPTNIPTFVQRSGRIGRDTDDPAIFLLMYEEWVTSIKLPERSKDLQDPDKPLLIPDAQRKKSTPDHSSSKRNRASIAVLELVLLHAGVPKGCVRRFLADYSNDFTPEGK
jgi:superfamily II DNA helicase RecQ